MSAPSFDDPALTFSLPHVVLGLRTRELLLESCQPLAVTPVAAEQPPDGGGSRRLELRPGRWPVRLTEVAHIRRTMGDLATQPIRIDGTTSPQPLTRRVRSSFTRSFSDCVRCSASVARSAAYCRFAARSSLRRAANAALRARSASRSCSLRRRS